MDAYLRQRTLEALGYTDNNDLSEAAKLLAEWALHDSRLLQALTKPWLKTAAFKAIEHVAIETLLVKQPARKLLKKPAKKVMKKPVKTTFQRQVRGSGMPVPRMAGNDPIIQTIIGSMDFQDADPNNHSRTLHMIAKAHAEKRLLNVNRHLPY